MNNSSILTNDFMHKWNLKCESINPNAETRGWADKLEIMEKMIEQLNAEDRKQILMELKDDNILVKKYNPLILGLIEYYAKNGERQKLVDLISIRCPRRITIHTDIEFYIVKYSVNIDNSFLILHDAFELAKSNDNKEKILDAIHRALIGMKSVDINKGNNDDKIDLSRKWYIKNKDNLILNNKYRQNALTDRYQTIPLFLNKSDSNNPNPQTP